MLDYNFSNTSCKNYTWADKQKEGKGVTIRVNELFNHIREKGQLSSKPISMLECLIFVTLSSNISQTGNKIHMGNHPKKHVGILYKGKVWNYSNTGNKVVSDTLLLFQNKFKSAYKTLNTDVVFYYGKLI